MKWAIYIATAILMGCASPINTFSALPVQHTVLPGETIASIAQKYYGSDNRLVGARAILEANPNIRDIEMEKGIRPEPVVRIIPRLENQ